ncbi:AI-2E family transporter [Luteimonas sp. M1R5S18]|jgi:predicted PurR-regulated permease PerM|uniref:AI-2E family transporter n=1 Tax=Luteimonas rhizosphaericola TaxID=3042024 RepID=A0ABT6JM35_9GAMM|nr:AI-2E family transporter [Luteimonas rhizosphaericola]MDH5831716.1 AI-2E family transporter [Luteimonas rhizosphaericola]
MAHDAPPVITDVSLPEAPPPPLRPRASTAALVLATLAVGYTLWAAQALLLPVLLAMFFSLVASPVLRLLRRLWVPRFLSALLVVCGGLAAFGALGYQMLPSAMAWAREAPREMRQLAPKLRELTRPMHEANQAAENFARAAGGETGRQPQLVRTVVDPFQKLTETPRLLASLLAVVLLTFFFMVYGEKLQRHAIALLPGRQQKKFTVEILQSMEREVSRYVLTITLINAVVGLLFACVLYLMQIPLPEALLWGTMVALLNFAPYVGPLIGMLAMLLVGFITFDEPLQALMPAAAYLVLHTIEGQVVTPIVLGRSMALSPLVLILALMLFGWLWGIVGLLLAVPLLVCVKLVLARVEGMEGWARLLE